MRKILFIFIIILLSTHCQFFPKNVEPKIKIHLVVKDKIASDLKRHPDCSLYTADLMLLNRTDSVIEFWSYCCSWQDNWLSRSDSIRLLYENCLGNYPIINILNPGEKYIYHCTICVKGTLQQIKERNLKLGFVLITKHQIEGPHEFHNKLLNYISKNSNIIWSDPIN
jgi:hypothetical protein